MSIEDIIRAWKDEEEDLQPQVPTSPLGRELSEQELLEIEGAFPCIPTFHCTLATFDMNRS
jgi:mersacidin/lichenicidin family type 2 lantibiotic